MFNTAVSPVPRWSARWCWDWRWRCCSIDVAWTKPGALHCFRAVRDLRCPLSAVHGSSSTPHFGLIQDLLRRIGSKVPDFYQDARWALFMVTITYVWKNLGYTFVIYLAALQGV